MASAPPDLTEGARYWVRRYLQTRHGHRVPIRRHQRGIDKLRLHIPRRKSFGDRAYDAEEDANAASFGDHRMTRKEERAFNDEEARELLGVSGREARLRGWMQRDGMLTRRGTKRAREKETEPEDVSGTPEYYGSYDGDEPLPRAGDRPKKGITIVDPEGNKREVFPGSPEKAKAGQIITYLWKQGKHTTVEEDIVAEVVGHVKPHGEETRYHIVRRVGKTRVVDPKDVFEVRDPEPYKNVDKGPEEVGLPPDKEEIVQLSGDNGAVTKMFDNYLAPGSWLMYRYAEGDNGLAEGQYKGTRGGKLVVAEPVWDNKTGDIVQLFYDEIDAKDIVEVDAPVMPKGMEDRFEKKFEQFRKGAIEQSKDIPAPKGEKPAVAYMNPSDFVEFEDDGFAGIRRGIVISHPADDLVHVFDEETGENAIVHQNRVRRMWTYTMTDEKVTKGGKLRGNYTSENDRLNVLEEAVANAKELKNATRPFELSRKGKKVVSTRRENAEYMWREAERTLALERSKVNIEALQKREGKLYGDIMDLHARITDMEEQGNAEPGRLAALKAQRGRWRQQMNKIPEQIAHQEELAEQARRAVKAGFTRDVEDKLNPIHPERQVAPGYGLDVPDMDKWHDLTADSRPAKVKDFSKIKASKAMGSLALFKVGRKGVFEWGVIFGKDETHLHVIPLSYGGGPVTGEVVKVPWAQLREIQITPIARRLEFFDMALRKAPRYIHDEIKKARKVKFEEGAAITQKLLNAPEVEAWQEAVAFTQDLIEARFHVRHYMRNGHPVRAHFRGGKRGFRHMVLAKHGDRGQQPHGGHGKQVPIGDYSKTQIRGVAGKVIGAWHRGEIFTDGLNMLGYAHPDDLNKHLTPAMKKRLQQIAHKAGHHVLRDRLGGIEGTHTATSVEPSLKRAPKPKAPKPLPVSAVQEKHLIKQVEMLKDASVEELQAVLSGFGIEPGSAPHRLVHKLLATKRVHSKASTKELQGVLDELFDDEGQTMPADVYADAFAALPEKKLRTINDSDLEDLAVFVGHKDLLGRVKKN